MVFQKKPKCLRLKTDCVSHHQEKLTNLPEAKAKNNDE